MRRLLVTGMLLGMGVSLLAACGNSDSAPNAAPGTGGLKVTELKTEFRTPAGVYVGCNAVTQLGGATTLRTNYALRFTVPGPTLSMFEGVSVVMKDTTSSQYDAYYTQAVTADQLTRQNGATYRAGLSTTSPSALYLPQSVRPQTIAVNTASAAIRVKTVRVSGLPVSGTYAQVSLKGAVPFTAADPATSADTVPVYDHCTVLAETKELL